MNVKSSLTSDWNVSCYRSVQELALQGRLYECGNRLLPLTGTSVMTFDMSVQELTLQGRLYECGNRLLPLTGTFVLTDLYKSYLYTCRPLQGRLYECGNRL